MNSTLIADVNDANMLHVHAPAIGYIENETMFSQCRTGSVLFLLENIIRGQYIRGDCETRRTIPSSTPQSLTHVSDKVKGSASLMAY